MIHLTARKTHYHYTHKTNAARFASSACTLARRCSASNEQLLSAHSSSTDQSPRTHDARHRRIHMAKLRTVQKRKNTCFCLVEDLKGALIHLMKLSKASRYQKRTVSKKSEKADPDARVKMVQQMWPVAAEFWVYQKSKLSALKSLSQQLIFTFQECWCKADACLGFHISQKCRFFCGVPHRKKQSPPVYRRFSPLFIEKLTWFFGISGHVDEGDHSFGMMIYKHFSAPCVPPTNDKPGIMDPLKTHLCGMWDLKPSIHGECVIPFLHSKVILFPDCFSYGDLREEVGRV